MHAIPEDIAKFFIDYADATDAEAEHRAAALAAAATRRRSLAAINAAGYSYAAIGSVIHISGSRVQQLVERGRTRA